MRITDLNIDGFGKFYSFSIDDLGEGLTILHGKNEAGKSTLLSFIRRMFFDFPNKRSNYNPYPPFNGGLHGGRLSVHTIDGNGYTIERYAGKELKLYLPDGTVKREAELRKILGSADKDVFENVYAFGLDELQDFNKLNGNSVSGKLYSAGTGIGAASIPEISTFFDNKKSALFKPSGKKPLINALFDQIKGLEQQITEIEDGQQAYDLLHSDIRKKEKEIADLKEEKSALLKKLEHIRALLSVWDDWVDLQAHNNKLEQLPVIAIFPENGLNRYSSINDKIQSLKESIEDLKSAIERNSKEQNSIEIDKSLLAQRDTILELGKGIEKYKAEKEELPNLKSSLKVESKRLKTKFDELGQDWNEEKLNNFDRSIPAIDAVRKHHGDLQDTDAEVKELCRGIQFVKESISNKSKNPENISGVLLEQRSLILKMADRVAGYNENVERVGSDRIKLNNKKKELTQVLRDIGSNWDETMLENFDLSGSAKARIKKLASTLEETESNIQSLETQLGWTKSEIDKINYSITGIDYKISAIDAQVPENKNSEMLAFLKNLRTQSSSLKEKELELRSLERDENFASMIRQTPVTVDQRLPMWPAGAFGVVGIAGFATGYVYDNLQGGIIACVGLFIIAVIYAISVRKSSKNAQNPVHNMDSAQSGNAKEQIKEDIRSIREKMLKDATSCGFEGIPEISVLEDRYDELKEYALGLKSVSELTSQRKELEKDMAASSENYAQLETELGEAKSAYQKTKSEWKDWLTSRSLDADVEPENIYDKLGLIREAKDKQTTVAELHSQVVSCEKSIGEFEEDAKKLLEICNYDVSDRSVDLAIIKLRDEVDVEYAKSGKVEQLKKDREDLEEQLEALETDLKEKEAERDNVLGKWHEWLAKYNLSSEMTTESIIDIFATINSCYELQDKIEGLTGKIGSHSRSIEIYENRIKSVLDACGRKSVGLGFDTELEILHSDLEKAVSKKNQLDNLVLEKDKLLFSLKEAEDKLSGCSSDMSALLKEGNAYNEGDFVKNAKIWDEIVLARKGYEIAESHVRKLSGNNDDHLNIIGELKSSKPDMLKTQETEIAERISEIDSALESLNNEKGSAINQIKQLEGDSEGSKLRLELETLKEEINEKSREWATYSIAQHILSKAMDKYEKERQPAVITEAQKFFSNITGGKYERIYSPLGSSDIFVEDKSGKRKNIIELSRGTAEQLYLSLRFGFIKELGKHSEPLPIIFDDILVNFDPVRSRNAISSIHELSLSNQVLYFTCHPETVEMFKDVVPDVGVIDLLG
ncbi:AAA family ATPase [uncultured Methanomethylovorans sp.]|uniref:AAA family ATPase n=1 Tax=uncultured Methanomethylovorans sp. TaxID=183759 RepID=UPI002AA81BCF|nr:AAA family ATPase [uncultured Methanomethylovorans sp.]